MMKTDDKLLVLSAKACGMPPPVDSNGVWSAWVGTMENGHWWNPLTDDGDALRLAVRLQISVCQNLIRVEASTIQLVLDGIKTHEDTMNQDWCAATRRAIVRAAAAIGEAMP